LIRAKPEHYTTGNEDDMKKFCDALYLLDNLVNFSPGFWRLCENPH
jgi:hypothetical protein